MNNYTYGPARVKGIEGPGGKLHDEAMKSAFLAVLLLPMSAYAQTSPARAAFLSAYAFGEKLQLIASVYPRTVSPTVFKEAAASTMLLDRICAKLEDAYKGVRRQYEEALAEGDASAAKGLLAEADYIGAQHAKLRDNAANYAKHARTMHGDADDGFDYIVRHADLAVMRLDAIKPDELKAVANALAEKKKPAAAKR